jgi:hypothetical protein
VDGFTFASKKEAARYSELKLLERSGYLKPGTLVLQPRFPLRIGQGLICTYVADFGYQTKDGKPVIEDTKGFRTPIYKLKAKLFHALYPDLRITEL